MRNERRSGLNSRRVSNTARESSKTPLRTSIPVSFRLGQPPLSPARAGPRLIPHERAIPSRREVGSLSLVKKSCVILFAAVALGLALFSLQGHPSDAVGDTISYAKLRHLIESNDLTSIEQVLAMLPAGLRSRYVLMYSSGSTQPATFVKPRVLLFTPDATFVMAFNDTADYRGYKKLEIIQFRDETDEFEFHEVRFNPGAVPPETRVYFPEKNPLLCTKCHRDDRRPNWDPFPITVGAYGSSGDRIICGSEEDRGFRAFIKARHSGPYGFLIGLGKTEDHTPTTYRLAGYPNSRFGAALNQLNFRRIRRILRNTPGFARFRHAAQAALIRDCSEEIETFLPAESHGTAASSFAEIRSDTLNRRLRNARLLRQAAAQFAGAKEEEMSDPLPFLEMDAREVTGVRYIVEQGMGSAMWEWTMAREADSFLFTSADSGLEQLGDLLLSDLLSDPLELSHLGGKTLCSRLRELSLNSVGLIHDRSDRQPREPDSGLRKPGSLGLCMDCHTGQFPVGPRLPFDDPEKLALSLKQPSSFTRHPAGNWRLVDEILYRINDVGGADQMPQGRALDPVQRQSMESYLRSLVIEQSP
jgi:hypothetical protein